VPLPALHSPWHAVTICKGLEEVFEVNSSTADWQVWSHIAASVAVLRSNCCSGVLVASAASRSGVKAASR